MIAIASGAVIGGWLAEAPYWFSLTGAGAALIFPLLVIALIPVGLAFGELTATLPFASSVDVWTCNAFDTRLVGQPVADVSSTSSRTSNDGFYIYYSTKLLFLFQQI